MTFCSLCYVLQKKDYINIFVFLQCTFCLLSIVIVECLAPFRGHPGDQGKCLLNTGVPWIEVEQVLLSTNNNNINNNDNKNHH